jgi:arsenite/tail-anchored protein-transporting ATPase
VVKTIRPILTRITTMPIAEDRIFAAVERLHRNLEGVGKLLRDEERASVRLVVNPEKMVIAEARRTYTYLSLFGYRVDAIVANRIIPGDVTDPYFGKWKEIQNEHLATIRESFQPVPVLTARLFEQEMVGFDLLKRMGDDVYEDTDETKVLHLDEPIRVQRRGPWYVLSVQLPFTDRTQLDIHRKAEELVVRVGSYKRTLILPHALQRLEIREARFVEDRLEIRFREKGGTAPARKSANPSGEERGRKHG